MKKSFIIFATFSMLFLHTLYSFRQVEGSAGGSVMGAVFNNKKKLGDKAYGRIERRKNLFYGVVFNADNVFNNRVILGGYFLFRYANRKRRYKFYSTDKSAPNTTPVEDAAKYLHENYSDKLDDTDEIKICLSEIEANKSLFSKNIKSITSSGIHIGIKLSQFLYFKVGAGFAKLNAKYRTNAKIKEDDAVYQAIIKDPTLIAEKIKKNGIEFRGVIGLTLAPGMDLNIHVAYTKAIKLATAGAAVVFTF